MPQLVQHISIRAGIKPPDRLGLRVVLLVGPGCLRCVLQEGLCFWTAALSVRVTGEEGVRRWREKIPSQSLTGKCKPCFPLGQALITY